MIIIGLVAGWLTAAAADGREHCDVAEKQTEDSCLIRWSSWWTMNRKLDLGSSKMDDVKGRLLHAEAGDLDSADRSFLEYGLSTAALRVLQNQGSITDLSASAAASDSDHWPGELLRLSIF